MNSPVSTHDIVASSSLLSLSGHKIINSNGNTEHFTALSTYFRNIIQKYIIRPTFTFS
ncbi:hypothetical protein [Mucilaginibacter jinjuensis]|uniref:Uncharacterized protein n=1 Tax=Mucilaginibacter jinjuensis TaxID=1176721 RepID=A0ABY7TB01_9SPHI|nr:hypothetical protein [Mucilaginibacter jinjuensis]WCT13374.1 hypothetical protein PQO05_05430 [Mucilaginibacter jinjuensis]